MENKRYALNYVRRTVRRIGLAAARQKEIMTIKGVTHPSAAVISFYRTSLLGTAVLVLGAQVRLLDGLSDETVQSACLEPEEFIRSLYSEHFGPARAFY